MTPAHQCSFVPRYLLEAIAAAAGPEAAGVRAAVADSERLRGRRELRATRWSDGRPPPGSPSSGAAASDLLERPAAPVTEQTAPVQPERLVHDAGGATTLPGELVRSESDPGSGDPVVDRTFDGLGQTFDLLATSYGRWSLDDAGMPLVASVHYGQDYANAFWDGAQLVFGDGDRTYFRGFTESLDVIAHELGHGVVQFTAGLVYVAQPGALNESVCDVFGALVRQRSLGQSAAEADWLIGADLFTDRVEGVALRSMASPGTAYDDPVLGQDPQPGHFDDFVELPHDASGDNGGVHINSGIPNRAFHLFATTLGGFAWERAGQVWYDVLATPGAIPKDVDFAGFAAATLAAAVERYGPGGEVLEDLGSAWEAVGVTG